MTPYCKIGSILFLLVLRTALAQYDGLPLERVHFQPMARDIIYPPLTNIHALSHRTVSEVHTRVIECSQMVTALRNEMAARLNESVPPPHQHCFITERDLSHLTSMNTDSTQGLRCDQHMLAAFPSALRRAAVYERHVFANKEGRVLLRVASIVQDIQHALANLTGLVVGEGTNMTARDEAACTSYEAWSQSAPTLPPPTHGTEEEEEEEEEEGQEERTGTQQLRSSSLGSSNSSGGTEESTGHQRLRSEITIDPTDESLLNRRRRRQVVSAEATPTATTPTRCTAIEDPNDQFIYVTELWLALYYLELDLKQKRNCLQV